MRLIKAFLVALLVTVLYCIVASCGLLIYAGINDLPAALYITLDSQSVIWSSFFQFLVDNSFCPWLMIVRGRPSTQIALEINCHFYGVFSLTSGFNLTNISALCAAIIELTGGPALGIGLLIFWGYVSHKLYSIAFSKLFNGRK